MTTATRMLVLKVLVLITLLKVPTCHVLQNGSTGPNAQYIRPLCRTRYLKSPVMYYPNTCATFNISLVSCGDIQPNPGPRETSQNPKCKYSSSNHRMQYERSKLLEIAASTHKCTLPADTWNLLKDLHLLRRPPTHLGC